MRCWCFHFLIPVIFISALSAQSDSTSFKGIVFTSTATDYHPSIDLNTANINLGIDFYIDNSHSIGINAGYITSYDQVADDSFFKISSESTSGFKIQVEGRRYLNLHDIFEPAILLFWPHILQYKSVKNENTGYYVAAHTFLQITETEREETVSFGSGPTLIHYSDTYTVNREALSLTLKIGYQCIKKYGLVFDYAVGFGFQYITSSSNSRSGTPDSDTEFFGKTFDSGSGFYPNILYQVKLGWAF